MLVKSAAKRQKGESSRLDYNSKFFVSRAAEERYNNHVKKRVGSRERGFDVHEKNLPELTQSADHSETWMENLLHYSHIQSIDTHSRILHETPAKQGVVRGKTIKFNAVQPTNEHNPTHPPQNSTKILKYSTHEIKINHFPQ